MSILTYNQVQLPLPLTTRFVQEAVYDDESQTDWCLTRFVIGVQCVLNTAYLQVKVGNATTPLGPAGIVNALRNFLLRPRKQLSFTVDGVEMIPQPQAGVSGTVDAMNGPKPSFCTLAQLSETGFLLNYEVVAHYWFNPSNPGTAANAAGGVVLFNRWKEVVDMDDCMYSRRTREGVYRIRSDNSQGTTPDRLRSSLAVLSVPLGFLRTRSRYEQSADGLTLRYHIEDREVYKMPPQPAFKAEGEYTDISSQYALFRNGVVRVRLYGSKKTDQAELLNACLTVASSKIQANLGKPVKARANYPGPNPLPTDVSIKVWLYDNIVEVTYAAILNMTQSASYETATWEGQPLVFTPLSDGKDITTLTPPYRDRGSAALLLQAASYYDPNVVGETLGQAAITTSNNDETTKANKSGLAPQAQMVAAGASPPATILPGQAGKTPEK